jgi:hypothetical protein
LTALLRILAITLTTLLRILLISLMTLLRVLLISLMTLLRVLPISLALSLVLAGTALPVLLVTASTLLARAFSLLRATATTGLRIFSPMSALRRRFTRRKLPPARCTFAGISATTASFAATAAPSANGFRLSHEE